MLQALLSLGALFHVLVDWVALCQRLRGSGDAPILDGVSVPAHDLSDLLLCQLGLKELFLLLEGYVFY